MEMHSPTRNLDVETCPLTRSEGAWNQPKALDECENEKHDSKVLLQTKKQSNAVHVVVVINEKENPHTAFSNIASQKLNRAECRICQEEEDLTHLDNPCACTGTLLYAHRKCLQRWCDEKGDTNCEICRHPYKGGYTAAAPQSHFNIGAFMDFRDEGARHGDHDEEEEESSNLVVVAAAQRRFLDADYEESNSSTAACRRYAALLLMALLLLRQAVATATASSTLQEDTSMLFYLFLLRMGGFLLPCYLIIRAINILQRRHQQEEASVHNIHTTSTEVAIILQGGRL